MSPACQTCSNKWCTAKRGELKPTLVINNSRRIITTVSSLWGSNEGTVDDVIALTPRFSSIQMSLPPGGLPAHSGVQQWVSSV